MTALPRIILEPIVRAALVEDFGLAGDVTARLLPHDARFRGRFAARPGAGRFALEGTGILRIQG